MLYSALCFPVKDGFILDPALEMKEGQGKTAARSSLFQLATYSGSG